MSRAVAILGFDRIRSAAMTLMLMEHLQNKSQAAKIKEDVIAGYFSGLLARELVSRTRLHDAEEAFICTMFHDLGRLLAHFYLAEEAEQVSRLIEQGPMDERQASQRVLAVSFEDLGIGVARSWNFPERMVQSMRRLPDAQLGQARSADERLRAIADLSSSLCSTIREPDVEVRTKRMRALVNKFGKGLGVTSQILDSAVLQSISDLKRDAGALDLRSADGFLTRAVAAMQAAPAPATDRFDTLVGEATMATGNPICLTPPASAQPPPATNRKLLLTAGMQDVTNALVGQCQLNDILRIIIETMYRAMGFTRVILCVRDIASNSFKGRFGFGPKMDEIIRRGFAIPMEGGRDVFQASLANGLDILIEDIDTENMKAHIPGWFRKAVPARSFALFPIIINKKPIAMLYGDGDAAGRLKFEPDELALLKTLRNQAVLAIRQ